MNIIKKIILFFYLIYNVHCQTESKISAFHRSGVINTASVERFIIDDLLITQSVDIDSNLRIVPSFSTQYQEKMSATTKLGNLVDYTTLSSVPDNERTLSANQIKSTSSNVASKSFRLFEKMVTESNNQSHFISNNSKIQQVICVSEPVTYQSPYQSLGNKLVSSSMTVVYAANTASKFSVLLFSKNIYTKSSYQMNGSQQDLSTNQSSTIQRSCLFYSSLSCMFTSRPTHQSSVYNMSSVTTPNEIHYPPHEDPREITGGVVLIVTFFLQMIFFVFIVVMTMLTKEQIKLQKEMHWSEKSFDENTTTV